MFHWRGGIIQANVVHQLRAYAHEAEVERDLHPAQLQLIQEHGWFRMFIPKSMGGLGLTLPEVVRLETELAWADGSTAWVATLCGGAGWFVGFVEPSVARQFFTGDRVCIAGSGSATGIATVVTDGYRIRGSWPYASGALHATAFTANCVIYENGRVNLNADGSECILPFIFQPDEVVVKHTWKAAGMIATASHSFSVGDVVVPAERCFEIAPAAATPGDAVYQYPFLQLAEATLTANVFGMTLRFLELTRDGSLKSMESPEHVESVVKVHQEQVHTSGVRLLNIVDRSWKELIEVNSITEPTLLQVSEASTQLVRACRACVDEIYPICMMEGDVRGKELNRVWRNIKTALSHALLRTKS